MVPLVGRNGHWFGCARDRIRVRDLAIVTIQGKTHYLGKWNSDESKLAYRRLLIDHLGEVPQTLADEVVGDPTGRLTSR